MRTKIASLLALLSMSFGCAPAPSQRAQAADPNAPEASSASGADASDNDEPTVETADLSPPADVATPPAGAEKTASGLASVVLRPGQGGAHPTDKDGVLMHYTGWTKDGALFDSSLQRGGPDNFPVDSVIKGLTEGLKLMTVGEKRRFWIPSELAYGDSPPSQGVPAGQLTFDVELLDIIQPPAAPADVAAPPPNAVTTKSGLSYVVLTKGTGRDKPSPTSRVTVHYSGWTTDGVMFDSSIVRGQPATFGLSQVIEGWSEGVQLMVVGEKARFWIPEALAYKGRSGAPAGTLVFDIELLDIEAPRPSPPEGANEP